VPGSLADSAIGGSHMHVFLRSPDGITGGSWGALVAAVEDADVMTIAEKIADDQAGFSRLLDATPRELHLRWKLNLPPRRERLDG
jgi:hypothetical protein